MNRIKITKQDGLYYWQIMSDGAMLFAGLQGFATRELAIADANGEWKAYISDIDDWYEQHKDYI